MSGVTGKLDIVTPASLLAFEHTHPKHTPVKEERIIRELGIAPARYYLLLTRVASSWEGIEADSITARRVRERAARRAA